MLLSFQMQIPNLERLSCSPFSRFCSFLSTKSREFCLASIKQIRINRKLGYFFVFWNFWFGEKERLLQIAAGKSRTIKIDYVVLTIAAAAAVTFTQCYCYYYYVVLFFRFLSTASSQIMSCYFRKLVVLVCFSFLI